MSPTANSRPGRVALLLIVLSLAAWWGVAAMLADSQDRARADVECIEAGGTDC